MTSLENKKPNPKFVNQNNISKYLYCSICEETFNNPIRIKECGHTFCKLCLKKWNKYNKNCPLCRKDFIFKNIKRDNIAYNIINDLEVFCNNKNCPWKGTLLNLKKHLKNCIMNPSTMTKSVKEIINENKRKSLILKSKIIDDLNKSKNDTQNDNEDDEEGRESVDTITSFNTRVSLRARLFNRNKVLVNNVLNNKITSGYSEYSIFSIIQENNIKI